MIKAFCFDKFLINGVVSLSFTEAHHVFKVLRARENEPILLINGQGVVASAHVNDIHQQTLIIDAIKQQNPPEITLYPALIKHKALDFLIREATAIGVKKIVPLVTDHCEIKLYDVDQKIEHWNLIAREACKQSGNAYLPIIESPVSLKKVQFLPHTFVAALQEDAQPIRNFYSQIQNHDIGIVIGPEGDFSATEYQFFREQNIKLVSLSRHILRAETAALYLLSIIDQTKTLPWN